MLEERQYFYRQDIYDILTGAGLLASGGGGSIVSARDLAETILSYSERVEYIDPGQVKSNAMAAVLAGMGSPQALKEKGGFKEGPKRAFELLEKEIAAPISYTVPIETGAVNQLVPMLVSVQKDIPVIDGDGGGRSFPKLSMATFCKMEETSKPPSVLSTEASLEKSGSEVIVYQKHARALEDLLRAITGNSKEFGGIACLACFLMECQYLNSGSEVMVKNTLTKARNVGQLIRESLKEGKDPSDAVISRLDGYKLARGTIENIEEPEKGGFDFTTVTIECEGDGRSVWVLGVNENLLALSDDMQRPLAMGPDMICYMGEDGPLSNADLEESQKVTLIGLRADPIIRRHPIVDRYMEECFFNLGYRGPYVPIEDMNKKPPRRKVI